VLLTWAAPASSEKPPSLLLVSHMDVVPCDDSFWDRDPFEAEKDDIGNIFGRGTQDMKSCGLQHLLSLRFLVECDAAGELDAPRRRDLHVAWMPDEEIGGRDGMKLFVQTDDFAALNVGVALDEGLASDTDTFSVFYAERAPWWLHIVATGRTGHGSRFVPDTAPAKLMTVVQRMLDFRAEQFEELERSVREAEAAASNGGHCVVPQKKHLGDVTTLNLTALRAGVSSDHGTFQLNVIPTEAMAGFDIRIPPTVNLVEFEEKLRGWCEDDLEGVTYEFVQKAERHEVSDISTDAEWWRKITTCLEKQGLDFAPRIFPAATDSRFLRLLGIPCYGFSPIVNTEILLHDHNEYLNENVFLKGCDIMRTLVQDLLFA
jgi:aminoacylase